MPPLSPTLIANIPSVYDVETPLEKAIAQYFADCNSQLEDPDFYGFSVATTATAPQFQKIRPRVEIEVRLMKGTKKAFGQPNGPVGPILNATFRAGLLIDVISGTAAEDKQTHAQFRALVRYLTNMLPYNLSPLCLPNHQVNGPIDDNGTVMSIKTQDGYQTSRLSSEFDLSVRPNSWQQLAA